MNGGVSHLPMTARTNTALSGRHLVSGPAAALPIQSQNTVVAGIGEDIVDAQNNLGVSDRLRKENIVVRSAALLNTACSNATSTLVREAYCPPLRPRADVLFPQERHR